MADFYKVELHNQTLARAIVGLFLLFFDDIIYRIS